MSTILPSLVEEIQKRAVDAIVSLNLEAIDAILGVGDTQLTPAQRIARFWDDANSGALDIMKGLRPDLYERTVNEFVRDVGASGLVNPPEE